MVFSIAETKFNFHIYTQIVHWPFWICPTLLITSMDKKLFTIWLSVEVSKNEDFTYLGTSTKNGCIKFLFQEKYLEFSKRKHLFFGLPEESQRGLTTNCQKLFWVKPKRHLVGADSRIGRKLHLTENKEKSQYVDSENIQRTSECQWMNNQLMSIGLKCAIWMPDWKFWNWYALNVNLWVKILFYLICKNPQRSLAISWENNNGLFHVFKLCIH